MQSIFDGHSGRTLRERVMEHQLRTAEAQASQASAHNALEYQKEMDDMPRISKWLWFADNWLIVSVGILMVVSITIAMSMNGMLRAVSDPESEVHERRGRDRVTDFSWGVELRVMSDRPVGVEMRKIGEDEQFVIFER